MQSLVMATDPTIQIDVAEAELHHYCYQLTSKQVTTYDEADGRTIDYLDGLCRNVGYYIKGVGMPLAVGDEILDVVDGDWRPVQEGYEGTSICGFWPFIRSKLARQAECEAKPSMSEKAKLFAFFFPGLVYKGD